MTPMDETGYIKRTPIKRQKVAIVGSGLAGLTTAHLLKKDNFDVEIFEMGPSPSLDAASMSVTYKNGGQLATERVDIPMRAFAGGYYTNLLAMYKYLKIPFQAQKFLFTFSRTGHAETNSATVDNAHVSGSHGLSRPNSGETPYFIHSSNNHRLPPVKPDGRSWLSYISEVLYLWAVYTYFTFCCFWFPPERKTFTTPVSGGQRIPTGKTESLREYLQRIHLPEYFVSNFLLVLISSVTTCPHETLLDFPAADITGYKKYMHKQPHYMVQGGVCQIQERLLEGIKVGLNRKVLGVERVTTGDKQFGNLILRWEETATGLVYERVFDQVVLAVSPYVVGKIYKPLSRQMSRIPCCEAEVVAHYDERVIEGVIDPLKSLSPINEVCYEKQNTQSPYPSQKLTQLLHFSQKLLGNTDAHIIQFRTTTQPSSMIFHKSSNPWTLLNNGQSVPSLVTESTHIHPPGVLLTTSTIYPLKNDKVLGASRFVRVLRTPHSRDVVQTIFRGKNASVKKIYVDEKAEEAGDENIGGDNGEEWRNGDDGVWLCGGWCWDGMVLLEGCVRSAMRIAVELGVEVPWKVEGSWEE